ncbi:11369_t:CDS:2 [Dentiscutata erythropus]|uniref:11369_t:CDS:1 n=1 Tax=Dentiscutata erythropus TaxID=1348616 RepID=A0A9N9H6L2_9GLOM|nr:11369_t:CDS:2 [Dentiscutata erythropus]
MSYPNTCTFPGIDNFHEWAWPQDDDIGYIYARTLPGIREWKKWSPAQVMKITKNHNLDKKLSLLKTMFHTGTANPQQKMSAQQMHKELILRAAHGEIETDNIPKITTIANWISGFYKKWKAAMAMRSIEEAETSRASNMSSFSK